MKMHLIPPPYLILIAVCMGNYLTFCCIRGYIKFPSHMSRFLFIKTLLVMAGLCQVIKSLMDISQFNTTSSQGLPRNSHGWAISLYQFFLHLQMSPPLHPGVVDTEQSMHEVQSRWCVSGHMSYFRTSHTH
jgi:hypothetical protein